MAGISLRSCCL